MKMNNDQMIWARQALLPNGWANDVLICVDAQGRIASVTADAPPQGHRVDTLLPAPVNLHSHAFQRAMAGMTEARGPDPHDTFWTWRRLMFRFLDHLTPDDARAIAAMVQMEMLEAGFGALAEFHYLHHRPDGQPYDKLSEMADGICAAAEQTGMGLTLLPVLYQYGGCDRRPLAPGQRRFGNDRDQFARLFADSEKTIGALPEDSAMGVAPHSLRAVQPDDLAFCTELAGTRVMHMHLAEQQEEVTEIQAAFGARPVEWLLDNAPVSARWCLIHCTQMTPAETVALARTHAVAGLCPITEASLGDGIFDGARYLGHGGRFGIGSDSNIRISLTEELRGLEYSQRLRDRRRAVLAVPGYSTGRILWEGAASGGAQAAGRAAGAIATGLWADMVALDGQTPDLEGRDGDLFLDTLIFSGDNRCIADVWSAGRHVVRAGEHINKAAIVADYRRVLARLRDAM
ncbi:formimidoylglutamate deiminase [Roseinatronobacter alkalisoli]|uniref:Formimidoylglutamate deiminase n=1 Tax=Roseinatronobacter alkalisoli TaxID=3028235 RepID=A0ABT5T7D7_9RHOB|nr:formimidoylglutamate deiminase [Roseinatronobacter sp. HJB301]MDD7970881.1 formimidoylglutamate deiminase [Roseinatronobacter sp. HJB301]